MQKVADIWKQTSIESDLDALCEKLCSLASVQELLVTVNLSCQCEQAVSLSSTHFASIYFPLFDGEHSNITFT